MSHFLDNKYVSGFFTLVIILYSTMLHPNLPQPVVNLFKNNIFKIAVLLLVLIKGRTDPILALVIAIAFVLTLDFIYTKESFEAFENTKSSEITKMPDAKVLADINAEFNNRNWFHYDPMFEDAKLSGATNNNNDNVCKIAYSRCLNGSSKTEPLYGSTNTKPLYGLTYTKPSQVPSFGSIDNITNDTMDTATIIGRGFGSGNDINITNDTMDTATILGRGFGSKPNVEHFDCTNPFGCK